jgi:hypothetical protein
MFSRNLPLFGLTILLFLSDPVAGQKLKLPHYDFGACPFECCTYREWTAVKDTAIYRQRRKNSPVAFRVKNQERVSGLTGVVITSEPGIGKALNDTFLTGYDKREVERKIRIRRGERFSLLTYLGEDVYWIWFKGKTFSVKLYDRNLNLIRKPKAVWWIQIRNKRGQTGWTTAAENFDGTDRCG